MKSEKRTYNAEGVLRLACSAADVISMMMAGTNEEIKDSIKNMHDIARKDFPGGPLLVRDALNSMCSELDLPMIFGASSKDSGKVL